MGSHGVDQSGEHGAGVGITPKTTTPILVPRTYTVVRNTVDKHLGDPSGPTWSPSNPSAGKGCANMDPFSIF